MSNISEINGRLINAAIASLSLSASGSLTGSLLGTSSWATNALTASLAPNYVLTSVTSSMLQPYVLTSQTSSMSVATASLALRASGSLTGSLLGTAATASSVSTLNQNVLITGSLTIGATSLGSNENTLAVGPAPAGGTGEGGQILLQASGGIYTSASMFDNYQNLTRILRGTNASSDAVVTQWDMHSKQVSFPAYNSTTAFNNTTLVGLIGFDSNGNLLTTNTGSSGGGGGGGGTSLGLVYAVSLGYIMP